MTNPTSQNPVAVITGAGGAVADAVISTFAQAGYQLALLEHSRKECDRLSHAYPDALIVQVDLTDEGQTEAAIGQVITHFGQIDALLNIAGGFAMKSVLEATLNDLEGQFSLNFRTLVNTTRYALPGMVTRGSGFVAGIAAGAALRTCIETLEKEKSGKAEV